MKSSTLAAMVVLSLVASAGCGNSADSASNGSGSGGGGNKDGGGGSSAGGTGGSGYLNTDGSVGDAAVSDAFDPDAQCAATDVKAERTPANILFLIDRSGSMNCNPPPTTQSPDCEKWPKKADQNQLSKWEITIGALKQALTGLSTTTPTPSVGLMFFNVGDLCGYPDSPAVAVQELNAPQLNALTLSLDSTYPLGATPIVGTVMRAYAYFHDNAASFNGNRFVVLLTDGGETCDPDNKQFLIGKAAEATAVGIRTFVLGAPGSEPYRAFLSQLAYEGGTPSTPTCDHSGAQAEVGDCHMDMTLPGMNFADELQKNLAAISAHALSCELEVPDQPDGGSIDYGKVNVVYTPSSTGQPETLPYDDQHPCSDSSNQGWQYADNHTKIILCGSACDRIKNDPGAEVSVAFGCQTQGVPK